MSWVESFVRSSNGADIQTKYLAGRDASKLAFIAHPYGRLGGTWDDRVVRALADHLATRYGYGVVLMNSRGVGLSSGSPSFSSIVEAEDYASVVESYAKQLPRTDARPDVLLCGYSAGALSASKCKALDGTKTRYLLISYPASLLWALTLFRTAPFTTALEGIVKDERTPVLSIRGTQDQFTGHSAYASWETKLRNDAKSASFVTVDGADHFWGRRHDMKDLLANVDTWLSES